MIFFYLVIFSDNLIITWNCTGKITIKIFLQKVAPILILLAMNVPIGIGTMETVLDCSSTLDIVVILDNA